MWIVMLVVTLVLTLTLVGVGIGVGITFNWFRSTGTPVVKEPENPKTKRQKDEPAKTPAKSQDSEAESALKCLMKLDSLTQTGINYDTYQTKLVDIKVDFDLAMDKIPATNPVRGVLAEAMDMYLEARNYWHKHLFRDKNEFVHYWKNPHFHKKFLEFNKGRELEAGISRKSNGGLDDGLFIGGKTPSALPRMWEYSSKQVKEARSLLSK